MTELEDLKQEIREEASSNPEKFFATEVLKEKGFSRGKCRECGMHFWSTDEDREICGEPECGDGYTFINDPPTEKKLDHAESWELFKDFMTERGYASIDRYPVVARWRDDVEFTGASIYCFQPYVVSGEAEPPARELVIPQPSLRFNDVENVGITGRHYTNFTMIGQTCFQPPERYDQDRYFRDMLEFATRGLGISREELVLHEDAWGGGGNLGACMEFFVDGLELFNQVYMFYRVTPEGYEELDLKVLDMGMGHERITWISRGTETSYESVMPETIGKLKERTGLEINQETWREFLPHSSELNVDEVEDIEEKWKEIAERMGMEASELKAEIMPAAALYSVAEHSRALLFALADGKLPSNTGGGHNLRMVYRRAQDFIEKHDWDLEMTEVAEWNAEELEPMFPELKESIESVKEILEVEKKKYEKSREKAREKLEGLENPSKQDLVSLYESHGVSPEMMEEHGVEVPEDFYSLINTENTSQTEVKDDFDISTERETEKLYYKRPQPFENPEFEASVVETLDDWVVLDRTLFYPEGGGQMYDTGTIEGLKVEEVQKQSGVVLHRVPGHEFDEGDSIKARIDAERRKQLTQHHSATHMVNAAVREELGDHVYQSGARKTEEKGRLDLTHYEKPGQEEVKDIEASIREWIIEDIEIDVERMEKSDAEQQYGFRIYQGGAPPGNSVRIVKIGDKDVEACGGTHLASTGETGKFYVTDMKRVQDGVIRFEYKAGKAAENYIKELENLVEKIEGLTGVKSERDTRSALEKVSGIFSVEKKQAPEALENFIDEIEELEASNQEMAEFLNESREEQSYSSSDLVERAREIFERRKDLRKEKEGLEKILEEEVKSRAEEGEVKMEIPTDNIGLLIRLARECSSRFETTVTLLGRPGGVSASSEGLASERLEEEGFEEVQGDEDFAKAFS